MNGIFRDRTEAGLLLAPKLREFAGREDGIVLSLPGGGVLVGFEVARKLDLPLDVLVVRTLEVPGQQGVSIGAIATGGLEVRNNIAITVLGIPPDEVATVVGRECAELERRERLYRGGRPALSLQGKTVILVADGIPTGETMRTAVQAVNAKHPRAVIVAAPVASGEAVDLLRKSASAVVTVITTPGTAAIADYYRDFREVEDREVRALLSQPAIGGGQATKTAV